jgi:plastocyanin domain-containing protein
MKKWVYGVGILVLILVGGILLLKNNPTENLTGLSNLEAQKVVLGIKNYNYYPNTVTVNVNQPVEISLDSSVRGCYRNFNIRELGISQTLRTPEDKLTFTPTKKGTYTFACGMGMGTGTLIVN